MVVKTWLSVTYAFLFWHFGEAGVNFGRDHVVPAILAQAQKREPMRSSLGIRIYGWETVKNFAHAQGPQGFYFVESNPNITLRLRPPCFAL